MNNSDLHGFAEYPAPGSLTPDAWEGATSKLLPDTAFTGHFEEDEFALAFARIECHDFGNKGWFEPEDQLPRDAHKLKDIPGVIVQGCCDVVCPMESVGPAPGLAGGGFHHHPGFRAQRLRIPQFPGAGGGDHPLRRALTDPVGHSLAINFKSTCFSNSIPELLEHSYGPG